MTEPTSAEQGLLDAIETRRRYLLHDPAVDWTTMHAADIPGAIHALKDETRTEALLKAQERVRELWGQPGNGYEGEDDYPPSLDDVLDAVIGPAS